MASKSAQETSLQYIRGRKTLFQIVIYTIFFTIGDFPYNSLYTQAVAYTTYFELGEPVTRLAFYLIILFTSGFLIWAVAADWYLMISHDALCH